MKKYSISELWWKIVKEAFISGYRACHDDVEDYDHDLEKQAERKYKEWKDAFVRTYTD